jgi:hypothetical protein
MHIQDNERYLQAIVSSGRLLANAHPLPDGRLVSHTDLRKALKENLEDRAPSDNGPLSIPDMLLAIEIIYGPEIREQVASRGQILDEEMRQT